MRKLPILLVLLLLLSLLTAAASAASAHAFALPGIGQPAPLVAPDDEEDEAEDDGEDELEAEDDETEAAEEEEEEEEEDASCFGEEDEELCEQQADEEAEAEECLLEGAEAAVKASPGRGKVRLTVRYQSFEPTRVNVNARLRGAKGGLHLGSDRARFRRSGVYHDTFKLNEREMARALAARQFAVDLQAAGTPGYCEVHLTASRAGAHKLLWG
jgi:hypothetical protein